MHMSGGHMDMTDGHFNMTVGHFNMTGGRMNMTDGRMNMPGGLLLVYVVLQGCHGVWLTHVQPTHLLLMRVLLTCILLLVAVQ